MKYMLVVFTLNYCLLKITADDRGRIVGGKYADSIRKYPYVTFLHIKCHNDKKGRTYGSACGAGIINHWFYLSAGHCVEDCSPIPLSKIFGVSGNIGAREGNRSSVALFKLHEKYNPDTIENDICLFKLKQPLMLGRSESRLSLLRNPPLYEPAVLAGWGRINRQNNYLTDILKVLPDIKILDTVTCLKIIQTKPPNTICARYKNYKPNSGYAAEGDSGSPLVVRGFIQVGLVSYMDEDIDVSITVYTEVSKFIDWIEQYTGLMYCEMESNILI